MKYKELIAQDKKGYTTACIFRSVSSVFAWLALGELEKAYPAVAIKNGTQTIEEDDGQPTESPRLFHFMQFVNSPSITPRSISFNMNSTQFTLYLMEHERGDNLDINAEVLDIFNEWAEAENGRRGYK